MSRIWLASPYFPPKIGGVERYAERVASGLADRGHDITVVTTGPPPAGGAAGRFRTHYLPARWQLSATPFDPSWPRTVRRLIRSDAPDVLITHAPVPGLADVCLAVRGRIPAIATYHSGSMKKGQRWLDAAITAYESSLLPALLRRADEVVTTYSSDSVHGIPSHYIPPGVDTAVFHPDSAVLRDRGLVLYAGRIEHASEWKGVGTLLRAFARLAAESPRLHLALAGGGDAVDHYQSMVTQLGIRSQVTFLGSLDAAGLADAYRRASLVVLPSETDAEAFGMVLIEAMACGTPVVASRVGGMPAVLAATGGGVLAEPGDDRSLADAIAEMMHDPERRRRLGAVGLERVSRGFRWEGVVDAFEALVLELVSPRGASRPAVLAHPVREGDLVARNSA